MVAATEDAIADGDLVDLAASGFDDADGGVAQAGGGEGGLLCGAGCAAAADAIHFRAGAYLGEVRAHKQLIGGRSRDFELFDFDLAGRGENQALSFCHASFLFEVALRR